MSRRRRLLRAEWLGLLSVVGCGRSSTLSQFSYSRPYAGEERLGASIRFAAGRLSVGPAQGANLFELDLQYEAGRFRPVGRYQDGGVELGVETVGRGGFRIGRRALPQIARVGLPAGPVLDLELRLGAAEGSLELGGLRLGSLAVSTGASRADIGFSRPNPGPSCRSASVSSGAGEVRIRNAGNSGCTGWSVNGGVGKVVIDLSGAWPADGRLVLNLAVGGATLRTPPELGIRLTMTGFLADFQGAGFAKAGKTYTSAGYEDAARKLQVEVNSAVGGVTVEPIQPRR